MESRRVAHWARKVTYTGKRDVYQSDLVRGGRSGTSQTT